MANILFIEPDQVLGRTYAQALAQAGHVVQHITTAQSGIHAADDCAPDVVILELQLIAHSGIEFLYEFRSYADWQNVPAIILSVVPPQEFNESVDMLRHHLGVQAYCYKPATSLQQLLRAVETILVQR